MTINQATKVDSYFLPTVEDLLASLGGGKTFTKLDLDPSQRKFKAFCHDKYTQGPIPVQQTAVWSIVSTSHLSKDDGRNFERHFQGLCLHCSSQEQQNKNILKPWTKC